MVQVNTPSKTKDYKTMGLVAAIVVAVAALGIAIVAVTGNRGGVSVDRALETVSTDALTGRIT